MLAQSRSYVVPFGSVNGMIFLDTTVNREPAVLLLDTGGEFSIVSTLAAGVSPAKFQAVTGNGGTGANGEYVRGAVDLSLSNCTFLQCEILVMNLSDVSKSMGERIDGFIGKELLREFPAV